MRDMDAVYRAHARTVYRYLLSLCSNEDAAEELTQETFYQAVKSADRFDGSCAVSTWLCAIAKNCLRAYWRKNPPTEEFDEFPETAASAEAQALSQAGQVALLRRMHALPEQTREVMHLRLLGGLSFAEIGEVLSISENAARVTFYRGKEKLKKELAEDEN